MIAIRPSHVKPLLALLRHSPARLRFKGILSSAIRDVRLEFRTVAAQNLPIVDALDYDSTKNATRKRAHASRALDFKA
jgi:hypothetical protein